MIVYFHGAPQLPQVFYYLFVFITLIVIINKYKSNLLYLLIIFIFYSAIFSFAGQGVFDFYKILVLIFTIFYSWKNNVFNFQLKGDNSLNLFFLLLLILGVISGFLNEDKWTIILSQNSRYVVVICFWYILRQKLYFSGSYEIVKLKRFTYELILVQIICSVWKLIILKGEQFEALVGTISHYGGAAGTAIPILGFITFWIYKNGKIKQKDLFFIAGLFLLGFLAGKRAVMFILPLVIIAFTVYIPRVKLNKSVFWGILLVPLVFYFGLRLTPSLNPDSRVWGGFDPNFAIDYAFSYQFGKEESREKREYKGRGGAAITLWIKMFKSDYLSKQDWFGFGYSKMYLTSYREFSKLGLEVRQKGSATGLYQSYVSIGFLGIIITILLISSMLMRIRARRIKIVIILLLAWEYFLYTGIIIRTPAYMVLIIYFIHYFNFISTVNHKSPLKLIN